MKRYIPKNFKFKVDRVLPSEQIINGEVIDNQTVRTFFHNGWILIEKVMTYQEAWTCIEEGYWKLVC